MKPVSLGYPVSDCLLLTQVDSSFFPPVVDSRSRRGEVIPFELSHIFRREGRRAAVITHPHRPNGLVNLKPYF